MTRRDGGGPTGTTGDVGGGAGTRPGAARRGALVVVPLLVVALLAAACTSGAGTAAPTTTATPPGGPSPTQVVTDCSSVQPGTHTVTVPGPDGSDSRTYLVAAPAVDDPAHPPPWPAIVVFHGYGGDAAGVLAKSHLDHLGPDHGVVVVAPQATGSPTAWRFGNTSPDVAFSDRLLDVVHSSPCIDPYAVWLAGFSLGSAWAGVYGCGHADRIRGILMHSALPGPACAADAGIDVWITHGTADPIVPFDGGRMPVQGLDMPLAAVPQSAAAWAARAGCDPTPATSTPDAHSTLSTWSPCSGGARVTLQVVDGLGHNWAGGPYFGDTLNPACVLVARLTGSADPVAACS